jgi:hypothetical protein
VTGIVVQGDMGIVCRWSPLDLSYDSMTNACSGLAGNQSNCSVNDVSSEGFYTRYVACSDVYGNGQNSTQNLNVQF